MITIGVLASHEGTTLQAVLDACSSQTLPARVGIVISNNAGSGAIRRARAAGVPAAHLSGQTHPNAEILDAEICATLQAHQVDIVLLAGYMKQLGPKTLGAFRNRILNTHPALLPKYGGKGMYGLRVHEVVLAAGESITGVSVHLVDEDYDTGPIIAQCPVPVIPGDTPEMLAVRVQLHERELVVEVLSGIANGTLHLREWESDTHTSRRLDAKMQSYDYAHRHGVKVISWDEFAALAARLAEELDRVGTEIVVGIARAGLFPATAVACSLRRELYPVRVTRRINDEIVHKSPVWKVLVSPEMKGKVVAVVDEIADTGETLTLVADAVRQKGAVRVVTASLARHTWASPAPNVSALVTDAFVIFPWDQRVLIAGEWQQHPEIVAALRAQGTKPCL